MGAWKRGGIDKETRGQGDLGIDGRQWTIKVVQLDQNYALSIPFGLFSNMI